MGEARQLRDRGIQFKQLKPGEPIPIDLKDGVRKSCECGCQYFIPVIAVYTISPLVSPTGQELIAQQPVLVCMDCKTLLNVKSGE